jgi:hypothetical protein
LRIHRLFGRGVVAHGSQAVFHLKREALAASGLKAAASLFIAFEPEPLAVVIAFAQTGDDGQREPIYRYAPAAKHALRQTRALGSEQIAAIVCKLAVGWR